jgi:D-3-phosphoglycerate dehydrogenase
LFGLPNVICTPHLGASTIEAQEKVAMQIADQISDYLLSGAINNAINAPSLSAEESKVLKPYLELARVLGSFVGQLTHDPIKSLTVTYGGEANDVNIEPLTSQVVQSLLEHHVSFVNSVNAREVARERNIDLIEAHNEGKDEYPCRITVTVETEEMTRSICGTLIQSRPRVIDVKGIPLESTLGEHMLYITNEDAPGVIGDIGTTTCASGINIANMRLGRDRSGGNAMVLLEIDETPSDEDLERLRAMPNINSVRYLHFPAL